MRAERRHVLAVLVCAVCVACNGGPAIGIGGDGGGTGGTTPDTKIDASRSSLAVTAAVELQGDSAITPVAVQVRNASGEPLAGVAVQLTVSGAALPATITPPGGTTDASGTFSASLTAVTWGKITIAAKLGAAEASLTSDLDVTCTPGALASWAVQPPSPATALEVTRTRTIADGKTPIRLLVSAEYDGRPMGEILTFTVPGACFRVSSDRPEVVLTPATGRTVYASGFNRADVRATSTVPGRATITAETPYGAVTGQVEFVAKAAWSHLGASGSSAPVDARALAVVPGGQQLVAFADGTLTWSGDSGATWQASNAPALTASQQSQWTDPSAWFDLVASPTAPGVVMGLARFASGDLLRSADGGRTFSLVASGMDGVQVHPGTGAWLSWPILVGAPREGGPYGESWEPLSVPFPSTWPWWFARFQYLPRGDGGRWLGVAWQSSAFTSSMPAAPTLFVRAADGTWSDVTGTLFAAAIPAHYEYLYWTVDVTNAIDEPALVFLSTRRGLKLGPSAYGGTWTGAWTSVDGAASWSASLPWSGRLYASKSTGSFRLDARGVVWKQTTAGEIDASVGLPDPVRSLAFDPSRPGTVYAATATGVYVTTTGGE